jgi:HEAT repeat protein
MFETLRDTRTYAVIFYAAAGWYTPKSGVKEKAKKVLPLITDDPSDTLFDILVKDADFNNKYIALQAESESSAPDAKKAEFATEGLSQGLSNKPINNAEIIQLSQLRLLSCKMLANSSAKDAKAVPYLEKIVFTSNYDINERLTTIETLGSYKSEEAAASLTKYLKQNNDWQSTGNTRLIDRRTVIATISALGDSGSQAGVEELIIVGTLNYTTEIIQAAAAARQKIK